MKKFVIVTALLCTVFICGCDNLKDSVKVALDKVDYINNGAFPIDKEEKDNANDNHNISVRICSYIDSKSTIEKTSVLDENIKKYEIIDSEKMYRSAKHKFKSSDLCDDKGKQVLPIVVKINGSKIRKNIFWALVQIDQTGKRSTIVDSAFMLWDEIKTDGIYLYSDIKEPLSYYDSYNKPYNLLAKGKYQIVIYNMSIDANFVESETLLATWDFEII